MTRERLETEVASAIREVERWAAGLSDVMSSLRKRFVHPKAWQRAGAYLKGLLSPIERKNGWQLAEETGDATPDGLQHLLNRATWSADAVRDDLQTYVVESLGDPLAVGAFDETGFLKKGTKSVGVQRQYTGTAGKIENCQVGVFFSLASPKGHALLDRELYLPAVWATDAARRAEAHVPEDVAFATKPELAVRMFLRAQAAGIRLPWVTGDEVYGRDPGLRHQLETHRQAYVLEVPCDHVVKLRATDLWPQTAATIAGWFGSEAWQRLSCGEGSKGPRVYDWVYLPYGYVDRAGWRHWLLVRRNLDDPTDRAYFLVYGPETTNLAEMVRIAGARWPVEECFELAKGEVGLDHYEVRNWHGWYRHITLAMWALAFLSATRAQIHAAEAHADGAHAAFPRALTTSDPARPAPSMPPPSTARGGQKKRPRIQTWSQFRRRRGLCCP